MIFFYCIISGFNLSMNLDELAAKAKKELDNDPDLIIETDIEEGRLIICRTGVDEDVSELASRNKLKLKTKMEIWMKNVNNF